MGWYKMKPRKNIINKYPFKKGKGIESSENDIACEIGMEEFVEETEEELK